jgi:DNA (cytosine-5)-methyltransferase 1
VALARGGPALSDVRDRPGRAVSRPRLLDLFAGAGGCSVGYHRAGFDVVGVDRLPHDDYPFELVVADAVEVAQDRAYLAGFDVVAASPPCPRYSSATPAHTRDSHPDLVPVIRDALTAWGGLYVIENVVGAPLRSPALLCGSAFGLGVRRHRLFESNALLLSPGCYHAPDEQIFGVYGDHGEDRQHYRPDGTRRSRKARDVAHAREVMGIEWMTEWDDLADAIPPAYTEHLGHQMLAHLGVAA